MHQGKKTLVLDLDETLVHSTFEPTDDSDLVVRVTIEGSNYNVYVKMRPGLDEFLEEVAEYYEVVVFTASMAKYADPVLDRIDKRGCISHRLFREHCVMHRGAYVKDLARLGRDLTNVVIVDVRA
jgi:RNA polymerase II subunit A small phosphatase-like protein